MQKEVLSKYLISTIRMEDIDIVISKYEHFKKETNTFSDIIRDDEICMTSNSNRQLFLDFLNSYNKISESINMKKFIEDTEDSFAGNEIIFWNTIIEYFEYCNSVKVQTSFLKKMNMNDFQDLVLYTFNRNIKFNNFISEYKTWNIEHIRIVYRLINTILSEMIDEFHDFETAISDYNFRFDLETEKYQFIWNLCEENRIYLMLKNIQETLYEKDTP